MLLLSLPFTFPPSPPALSLSPSPPFSFPLAISFYLSSYLLLRLPPSPARFLSNNETHSSRRLPHLLLFPGIVSSGRRSVPAIHTRSVIRFSIPRLSFFFSFLFLSFWRGARRGKILFSVKSKALESLSNLFPRVYGASEREPAIFLKEQGEQEGNDLWRSSRKKKHEIRGCIGWDDEGGSRGSSSLAGNARRIGGREESGAILRGQVLSPRPI